MIVFLQHQHRKARETIISRVYFYVQSILSVHKQVFPLGIIDPVDQHHDGCADS